MRHARREVADGELRAFVSACSRARRLLYVTAVLDDDERPSVFLDLLNPGAEHHLATVPPPLDLRDRKSTRLNSSHVAISYAVFCLKKKNKNNSIKDIHNNARTH